MKRNGFRTVVVLALTIFLLNAPVCATASRLQDTCAEARDEVALRPEWMRILHDTDRKSTRLNSSHSGQSRMPSSA